jgi:hypothetical protein
MSIDIERARAVNHAAYARLKAQIDKSYPANRYVAIREGRIVADAPTFEGLYNSVSELLTDPEEVMVVQAGIDYPKKAIIFAIESLR